MAFLIHAPSSRATVGRPGIHAGALPAEVQEWIPGLRFAAPGMTRSLCEAASQDIGGLAHA